MTDRAAEAYEAGLRAGYAHGYDIGLAHGRAQADADLEPAAADLPAVRLDGPDRDELRARGQIGVDHTRPPALPVRLWTAQDWAKADDRNLPITEAGHAQWREAIGDGRVPPHLADAYASALDRDSARILGHLERRARSHPDAQATGLHDMPDARWTAAVEALGERGHRIDTTLVTRNETGYALRDTAELADAVTRSVADTDRALAALRARLAPEPAIAIPAADLEALDRDRELGR